MTTCAKCGVEGGRSIQRRAAPSFGNEAAWRYCEPGEYGDGCWREAIVVRLVAHEGQVYCQLCLARVRAPERKAKVAQRQERDRVRRSGQPRLGELE